MMVLTDYLLLVAVVSVLLASIAMVVKRHRRGVAQDRETARLLSHMATTVNELHRELDAHASRPAEQIDQTSDQHVEGKELTPAHPNQSRTRSLKYVYMKPTPQLHERGHRGAGGSVTTVMHFPPYHVARNREEGYFPFTVANWWERPDPIAEPDSYRAVLGGSTFDDAVIHAAKVGVIDTDQADALIFWAESTTPIRRTVARDRIVMPAVPNVAAVISGLRRSA